MERLPYIDEHATTIGVDRSTAYAAVGDVVSVPIGFAIDEVVEPERYALRGRHWFSVYRLVFVLTEPSPGRTTLTAETYAAFPGFTGKVYRALVIGSGAHRIVVRRMLRKIAQQAVSPPSPAP